MRAERCGRKRRAIYFFLAAGFLATVFFGCGGSEPDGRGAQARQEGGARRENRAIWRGGRRGKRRSLLERAEIGRGKARGVRAARNFVRAVRRAGWGASPMRFGVGARARVAREI